MPTPDPSEYHRKRLEQLKAQLKAVQGEQRRLASLACTLDGAIQECELSLQAFQEAVPIEDLLPEGAEYKVVPE